MFPAIADAPFPWARAPKVQAASGAVAEAKRLAQETETQNPPGGGFLGPLFAARLRRSRIRFRATTLAVQSQVGDLRREDLLDAM